MASDFQPLFTPSSIAEAVALMPQADRQLVFAELRSRFCLRCGKSVIAMRSIEREYYTRVCGCSP